VTGKQIVARLLSTNTPITVLDKVFYEDEVDALRKAYPRAASKLKIVHGDIRDPLKLKEAMTKDVAGVINLAAVSRVMWCLENEPDCTNVNVHGAEQVIKALPGGWFLQASSREVSTINFWCIYRARMLTGLPQVYGVAKTMPVKEDTPHNAANVYGESKAKAEDAITAHLRAVTEDKTKDLNVILLRFSNIYGSSADHRERLIPAIMTNALSHRPIQIVGGDQDVSVLEDHSPLTPSLTWSISEMWSTPSPWL